METLFWICAVAGGTLVLAQVVLSLVGLGHMHDAGGDHGDMGGGHDGGHGDHGHGDGHHSSSSMFVGILTLKSCTAAVTFFGLAGLSSLKQGLEQPYPFLIAIAAGTAALISVGWLMKSLYKLRADGSLRLDRAVGKQGKVYLSIPGQKGGVGKIQLTLQNRTVELLAITAEQALPAGAAIVVVAFVNPQTVEVAPVLKG